MDIRQPRDIKHRHTGDKDGPGRPNSPQAEDAKTSLNPPRKQKKKKRTKIRIYQLAEGESCRAWGEGL